MYRDPTSEQLYLYELKTALFDNGDPEKSLLLICNFQINLEVSVRIVASANTQYLHTILRGKELHQLDGKYDHSTFKTHYFGFRSVLFPVNDRVRPKTSPFSTRHII